MLRRLLVIAVVLSCPWLGSFATVPGQRGVRGIQSPNPAETLTRSAAAPATPFHRLLLPYLQHLHRAGTTATRPSGLSDPAPNPSGPSPNFGGYVAPPHYPAVNPTICITEPDNCGVESLVSGDFDKDGKPDVAVSHYDGNLDVLMNDGKGGLKAPVTYSNPNFQTSIIAQQYAVDVNHDGYLDVVLFDMSNDAVIVYLNQKNGTFATPLTINLGFDYGSVFSIAFGDVNGDGTLDLVALSINFLSASSDDVTLETLLGKGDGTFQAATRALTQTVNIPYQVNTPPCYGITLGDINGDGRLDLAIDLEEDTSESSRAVLIPIAFGNGDGSFTHLGANTAMSIDLTSAYGAVDSAGVQMVDLNGDGKADLAVDVDGVLYVAAGDGTGRFGPKVVTAGLGGGTYQLIYADVNGDNIPDLIQSVGNLNVWLGKGDGTFTVPANGNSYIVDGGGSPDMAMADFDGDGKPDIALLSGYGDVSVVQGAGGGLYRAPHALMDPAHLLQGSDFFFSQLAADVNGDGLTDAIFINAEDPTAVHLVTGISDGKGNFKYLTSLPASSTPSLAFVQPVQVDFNNDGKQDLLIADGSGGLFTALSKGDGTFLTPERIPLPALACAVSYAATADLNDDNRADVVLAYGGDAACTGRTGTPSGFFVMLGKGDGTFATPAFTPFGGGLYSVTIADMNMDGTLDLLLNDLPVDGVTEPSVTLAPGNGDGTFGTGYAVSTSQIVSQVIAGDYNQDGKPDLVLLSEGDDTDHNLPQTGGVLLMEGRGDGTFRNVSQVATGNFFINGQLADVNGDGIADLTVALYSTVGIPREYLGLTTLLGLGGGSFGDPINALASLGSESPLFGNFFSDNAPDVLLQTQYGSGLFLAQGGTALKLTGSSQSIVAGDVETLTVSLAASMAGRPAPTGTVAFYDGSTLLGNAALDAGSATYSTSELVPGAHSIVAVYSGDANFNLNTSQATAVSVAALTPAFTLSSSAGNVSLKDGQSATVTLTLAANSSFTGTVTVSCAGAPAKATCLVNPGSITLGAGNTATASLVLTTTTSKSQNKSRLWPSSVGAASVAALFWFVRGKRSFRRNLAAFVIALLGFTGLGLIGCGIDGVSTAAKGSYSIKVTATPSTSGVPPQIATIVVTIQ